MSHILIVVVLNFMWCSVFFFFQAEDGIRDLVRSRGLGDVYKRQEVKRGVPPWTIWMYRGIRKLTIEPIPPATRKAITCLLYTSDAADDLLCVDLGGRRIIKKKNEAVALVHEDYEVKCLTSITWY